MSDKTPACGGAGAPSPKYVPPHKRCVHPDGPYIPAGVHIKSVLLANLPMTTDPGKFPVIELLEMVNTLDVLGESKGNLSVFHLDTALRILAADWNSWRMNFSSYGDDACAYVRLALLLGDYLMIPSGELKYLKRKAYKAGGLIRQALDPKDIAAIDAHYRDREMARRHAAMNLARLRAAMEEDEEEERYESDEEYCYGPDVCDGCPDCAPVRQECDYKCTCPRCNDISDPEFD
jgi:hypothetical protein